MIRPIVEYPSLIVGEVKCSMAKSIEQIQAIVSRKCFKQQNRPSYDDRLGILNLQSLQRRCLAKVYYAAYMANGIITDTDFKFEQSVVNQEGIVRFVEPCIQGLQRKGTSWVDKFYQKSTLYQATRLYNSIPPKVQNQAHR